MRMGVYAFLYKGAELSQNLKWVCVWLKFYPPGRLHLTMQPSLI